MGINLQMINSEFSNFLMKFKKEDYGFVIKYMDMIICAYNTNPDTLSNFLSCKINEEAEERKENALNTFQSNTQNIMQQTKACCAPTLQNHIQSKPRSKTKSKSLSSSSPSLNQLNILSESTNLVSMDNSKSNNVRFRRPKTITIDNIDEIISQSKIHGSSSKDSANPNRAAEQKHQHLPELHTNLTLSDLSINVTTSAVNTRTTKNSKDFQVLSLDNNASLDHPIIKSELMDSSDCLKPYRSKSVGKRSLSIEKIENDQLNMETKKKRTRRLGAHGNFLLKESFPLEGEINLDKAFGDYLRYYNQVENKELIERLVIHRKGWKCIQWLLSVCR